MVRSIITLCAFIPALVLAQVTPPDPSGFQGLIVETYYVADAQDAADLDGGGVLPVGSTVYRVYADLKPGYRVLTVGGFPGHAFTISTSTAFFNNDDRGEAWGRSIPAQHLNKNTVAIDSWLTLGSASTQHWGVVKAVDPDGSIVGGSNNDNELLVNVTPAMGAPLTESDGLWSTGEAPPTLVSVGEAPNCFDAGGDASYDNDDFAWAILGDYAVPDPVNRVLLGQFTTDGLLQFCMNLSIKIPDSLVCDDPECYEFMEFFWELLPSDTSGQFGEANRFAHPSLCFSSDQVAVDCQGVAGGPAIAGTPCNDGIDETTNDVYAENCACIGEDCAGVLGGNALPGEPCDDENEATVNDTWMPGCLCDGIVAVDELMGDVGIALRPNPTEENVMLTLDGLQGQEVSYTLRDVRGMVVEQRSLGILSGTWTGIVRTAPLAAGVYLLDVQSEGDRRTLRIVRQ
jgi:hypothetical protein